MKFNLFLLSAAAMVNTASGTHSSSVSSSKNTVELGDAGDYVILSKAGISTTISSTITGDIAVSPIAATAITGFSLLLDNDGQFSTAAMLVSTPGRAYAASYGGTTASALTTAVGDMEIAYTDAAGRSTGVIINGHSIQDFNAAYGEVCNGASNCYNTAVAGNYDDENPDSFLNLGDGEIGGKKLAPGVYTFDRQVNISSDVTFVGDATDVFIIQTSKGVMLADGADVVLNGGALAKNIFWSVAENVVVGTSSTMNGVLLVKTDVAIKNGSTVNGRILAQTAVTLDQNIITQPL